VFPSLVRPYRPPDGRRRGAKVAQATQNFHALRESRFSRIASGNILKKNTETAVLTMFFHRGARARRARQVNG